MLVALDFFKMETQGYLISILIKKLCFSYAIQKLQALSHNFSKVVKSSRTTLVSLSKSRSEESKWLSVRLRTKWF